MSAALIAKFGAAPAFATTVVCGRTASALDGIPRFTGSTGKCFAKSHAGENGATGLDIGDSGNTIAENHADKNMNLGSFASRGNVDGGGNHAKKNGNRSQCVGVACN